MRKRLLEVAQPERPGDGPWLELERLAEVEITSEDPAHPIEAALLPGDQRGWRAAEPGQQRIRLLFHQPQRVRRIRLRFLEPTAERTQEFVLGWSSDGGRSFRDVVRQQFTFSPGGATSETEDFRVELAGVTTLELAIVPDQGRGAAAASVAEWRVG